MHMDVDNSGPQQTSTSVAAAAGSTRGVLQKITVPSAQAQGLKQVVSSGIFLGSFVLFFTAALYFLSFFPWAIFVRERDRKVARLRAFCADFRVADYAVADSPTASRSLSHYD